jgi:hypothetical protein
VPAERNRYTDKGQPAPCVVRVAAPLAAYLYREAKRRGYSNETDLVNAIVRAWTESQEPMDWPKLLKELKAEDDEEERKPPARRRGKAG